LDVRWHPRASCTLYPQVELELKVEARMIDIVRRRSEAGLPRHCLNSDMAALQIASRSKPTIVASPTDTRAHGLPAAPQ
jgi:hypothetical protein